VVDIVTKRLPEHKKRRSLFMSIDDIRRENLWVRESMKRIAEIVSSNERSGWVCPWCGRFQKEGEAENHSESCSL